MPDTIVVCRKCGAESSAGELRKNRFYECSECGEPIRELIEADKREWAKLWNTKKEEEGK